MTLQIRDWTTQILLTLGLIILKTLYCLWMIRVLDQIQFLTVRMHKVLLSEKYTKIIEIMSGKNNLFY
jgi:hypothetical protein